MENQFFKQPILNSPYECSTRHWKLDTEGQPTHEIEPARRSSSLLTPIPKPQKRKAAGQKQLAFDEGEGLSTADQVYAANVVINQVRDHVTKWRNEPDPAKWNVTLETQRLLEHWRHHQFSDLRPFFCQIEAAETVIWLTEVAPHLGKQEKALLAHLASASTDANPGLERLALKLATGTGKTTVMAMLIAWQTVNAVRRPGSGRFTRGFLVVTPGLTIRERLRVLQPNDPDSYYESRELVPRDMIEDVRRAKIVIFVRSEAQLDRAMAAAVAADLSYQVLDDTVDTKHAFASVATMHLAKGLEFRAIAVIACDDEVLPLQERIETVADESDLEDVYNTERHLLYVACTRAREQLLVTAVNPASVFLDDLRM